MSYLKYWHTTSGYKITRVLSGRSNVFLISNGETDILVDTSPGLMWKILQRRLERLEVRKLSLLILTHSHFDHAANARKIKEKYGARVIIHKSESPYLEHGDNILPEGTNWLTGRLVRLLSRQFLSLARYDSCMPDITPEQRLDLREYGFNAYLMHTPGHTHGSMSLIIDDEIALVGDTMFGIFRGTIFPPFAGNVPQLIESWNLLLKTGCSIFLPSHGSANNRKLVEKDYDKRAIRV